MKPIQSHIVRYNIEDLIFHETYKYFRSDENFL